MLLTGLRFPDGTRLEFVVAPGKGPVTQEVPVRLPTFRGDGLQFGSDLDDSRAVRQELDAENKPSQRP